jgi:prepilin-type N-terminal cleavage/methylation domain-containing protein
MRKCEPQPAQAGFTLVELMISLVIFSFAIAGILSVAVAMTNGMREQRAAVQAETAVRVPMDFLSDALRQASPGVPLPKNLIDAGTCTRGALTVSNAPGGTDGAFTIMPNSDVLDVIYAAGAVVTSTRTDYTTGTTSLTVNDASQLSDGDYIVITDFTYGHLVRIASKNANVLTLDAQCGGALNLPTCAAN